MTQRVNAPVEKRAYFRIIMRDGLYIPQERVCRFFWHDLPKVPDRPLRTTHSADKPMFYEFEVAEEFISTTLDYRRRMKDLKDINMPFVIREYDEIGFPTDGNNR